MTFPLLWLRAWHFLIISVSFFDLLITSDVQKSSVSVKKGYINNSISAQLVGAMPMSPNVSAKTVDAFLDNWKTCK